MNGSAPNCSLTGSQVCARQEAESELCARWRGVDPELIDQEDGDQEHAGRKDQRDQVGDLIAVAPKCH